MQIQIYILAIVILIFSIVVHEVMHGYVAYKLGDSTAKFMGRLTLNPIPHIDLLGTIIIPLLLIVSRSPILFGWAKPVPVNFNNLRNPKKDSVYVALAGPASNFVLAIVFAIFFHLLSFLSLNIVFWYGVYINLILGIFNLIPIPPLDGGRIAVGLLPLRYSYMLQRIEPFGIYIVVILLFLGFFSYTIFPLVNYLSRFLVGGGFYG
ncbi:MAG: site-2 protease family protein [Deltaproteobacteria bacterium]|nr:site-2 protease family protein [Deltaproteobacteria bacterium]